jgi:hypothetical protein
LMTARKKKQIEILQRFIIKYLKAHPCVDCTVSDIRVLEFDHLRDKDMNVSHLVGGGHSLKRLIVEIEKCVVVCANCHRIRTYTRNPTYRTLLV